MGRDKNFPRSLLFVEAISFCIKQGQLLIRFVLGLACDCKARLHVISSKKDESLAGACDAARRQGPFTRCRALRWFLEKSIHAADASQGLLLVPRPLRPA